MSSPHKHMFSIHNYKRPTFCKHCNQLLVGLFKQGMRCKRCNVDIHQKCKVEYESKNPCIEIMKGYHNFQEKTYHQPTYCDYCNKLLVGITKQGLRCSECKANVHVKCEEKIEPMCENTKILSKRASPTKSKSAEKQPSQKQSEMEMGLIQQTKNIKKTQLEEKRTRSSSLQYQPARPLIEEKITPSAAPQFAKMPPSSSNNSRRASNAQPHGQNKVESMHNQVHEVEEIVKENIKALEDRQNKLEHLEDQADSLNEKSLTLQKISKDIKKKYWWKNRRCKVAMVVAVILLIIVIVLAIVIKTAV